MDLLREMQLKEQMKAIRPAQQDQIAKPSPTGAPLRYLAICPFTELELRVN